MNTLPSLTEAGAHLHARSFRGASPARSTPGFFTPGAHRAFTPLRPMRIERKEGGSIRNTIEHTRFEVVPHTAEEYARMEREERNALSRELQEAEEAAKLAAFQASVKEPASSSASRRRNRRRRTRHPNKR